MKLNLIIVLKYYCCVTLPYSYYITYTVLYIVGVGLGTVLLCITHIVLALYDSHCTVVYCVDVTHIYVIFTAVFEPNFSAFFDIKELSHFFIEVNMFI